MNLRDNFSASAKDFDWSPYPTAENGKRWTAGLKQGIVDAINQGALTANDVQARYADVTREELDGWIDRNARMGRNGLMVTKTQKLGR